MQDKYVGDIGDFGKFALLNVVAGAPLRSGVIWYRNDRPEINEDGNKIHYSSLRHLDPAVYDHLKSVRSNDRTIAGLEKSGVLPANKCCFGNPVPCARSACLSSSTRQQQCKERSEWFSKALNVVAEADVVYLDPDNGLAPPRCGKASARSVKYVYRDEIEQLLDRKQSVILYQHLPMVSIDGLMTRQRNLLTFNGITSAWALSFHRISVRLYYFFAATKEHATVLRRRLDSFLASGWGAGKNPCFRFCGTLPTSPYEDEPEDQVKEFFGRLANPC
ncbi:MAG: hypothetical protein AB7O65_09795 [Candidatus Korobacteraceae bacterium]